MNQCVELVEISKISNVDVCMLNVKQSKHNQKRPCRSWEGEMDELSRLAFEGCPSPPAQVNLLWLTTSICLASS